MKQVPQERLDFIVDEVFGLLEIDSPFDLIHRDTAPNSQMDARLAELLSTRHAYEVIELATYLRASSSRSQDLPTWQPLLNAAIELGQMRGEPVWDIFYGMVPRQVDPERNTGQPVYKPHQT